MTDRTTRGLTPTETEVLDRLIAGNGMNKDIAGAMGLSQKTVDGHLHNARRKLRASSRVQLALMWHRQKEKGPPV